MDRDVIGKYHKGYTKTKVYTTNDPRITRPFVYGICGLFFAIGLIVTLFGLWIIGIPFIAISIFAFIKSKKDIDKIGEDLKSKGHDVTVDSIEEKEQLKEEIKNTIGNEFKDVTSNIFTKDKYNWFMKNFLLIYGVIIIVIPILLGIVVNIYFGLFIFVLLLFIGILYYHIILKIFNKSRRK